MSSTHRAVHRWLVASAVAVALAVAVGGITRLTESGLSITQWQPVSGVLPPLSAEEWTAAFERYLQIPEAQTVHRGITLAEFRALFWWEWIHRLLARGVGLVLALPYGFLLLRGRIPPGYRLRLALLPALAAVQGALGWYMVQSGLAERTDVSAYRLTAHLGIALIIYLIAIWTALELRPAHAIAPAPPRVRSGALAAVVLVVLTILSGGFVAGLDAGRVFNTFPLMGGQVVPPGYRLYGFWRNAFENPAAAQFHHRILALTTVAAILLLARACHAPESPAPLQRAGRILGVLAFCQLALGIVTLLLGVPIGLGVPHQIGGLAVLTAALVAARRSGVQSPR
jgi:cytochrome c oxidase assembly protein subunit 15